MDNTTFFSVASSAGSDSDATFLTCVSGGGNCVTGRLEVFSDSQILDDENDDNDSNKTETEGHNSNSSTENLDIAEGDEEDSVGDDPTEEGEKTAVINEDEEKYENMLSERIGHVEHCNSFVMSRSDSLKELTAMAENETKDAILERDQALMDLRSVEQAFSDVHRKYERAKQVLENLKRNEEHLMVRDEELQLLMASKDEKGEAFKQEMQQTLDRMYNDLSAKLAAIESENAKLAALHRRAEMRTETLEAELAHKQKENAQLNLLADDLIGKNVNN